MVNIHINTGFRNWLWYSTMLIRAVALVDGRIQGVGFRYFVRTVAKKAGITGLVRNLEDGRVEVVCEGDKKNVEEFIDEIKVRSPPIEVESVEVRYDKPTGEFKTFRIVTGDMTEEMVEGFSTGAAYFGVMFQKQDQTLSKQDQMLQKQDQMLQKQDQMLERQDQMLQRQDQMLHIQGETLQEIKGMRSDLKVLLDERLAMMERDIAEIRAKMGMR